MALSYVPNVTSHSVMMDTTFNSYRSLWIFQQVGTDSDDIPIYVIINKFSGNVLDNYEGASVEALNNDTKDRHHHWKLVPCHGRYFAIVNVATSECIKDGNPSPEDDMAEHDRRCCWTLVSYRHSDYDTIALDTDISSPSQEYFDVVKRLPKKHPKGKGNAKSEPSHIPDNPRIRQILYRLLSRLVDLSRLRAMWGLNVPRSLQVGWTRDGWIRIDIQGTYNDQGGVRVANVQGQWNNDTFRITFTIPFFSNNIFHDIIPTGITFGRARIRQAMQQSLRTGSSVRLDAPDNAKASGSKRPPNTSPKPPGPGAPPAGQFWLATVMSWIVVASMGVMLL